MDYELHDLIGNLGVALILASYLLVQMRRLDATGLPYLVANALDHTPEGGRIDLTAGPNWMPAARVRPPR